MIRDLWEHQVEYGTSLVDVKRGKFKYNHELLIFN